MPELPDVELYLHALRSRIVGERLAAVRLASPFLLRSVEPPLEAVIGREVRDLSRLGKRVVWDMGDGHSITCQNPGTSFSGGSADSPTCGYRYLAPSRNEPGGVYTVTATTHWLVTWAANTGDGGTLSTDVPDTTTITIDELEVVTS